MSPHDVDLAMPAIEDLVRLQAYLLRTGRPHRAVLAELVQEQAGGKSASRSGDMEPGSAGHARSLILRSLAAERFCGGKKRYRPVGLALAQCINCPTSVLLPCFEHPDQFASRFAEWIASDVVLAQVSAGVRSVLIENSFFSSSRARAGGEAPSSHD